MGIPAGIQIPLQTFQNQFGSADIGKSLSAVFLSGINFDFNTVQVSGVGGSAGYDEAIFADYNADAQIVKSLIS